MARHLIVGASRGIGAAVARHLVAAGQDVLSVSRGTAAAGRWIAADIGTDQGIRTVADAAGGAALDSLLFLGGIWERGAFTADYDFFASPPAEIRKVLSVNLVAPILLAQALAPALGRAANPRIVLIGSLSGLPNLSGPEVANTAAKFGLQGAAEALSRVLRPLSIGVTIINPGNVATEEVQGDIAEGRFGPQVPLAIRDLIDSIDLVLRMGPETVPTVINLTQKWPETA